MTDFPPGAVALLTSVICGDEQAIRALGALGPAAVRNAAWHHGVLPLAADRFSASCPDGAVADLLRKEQRAHAVLDLTREVELRTLLAALAEREIECLLMKGAALAYSHYARPDLRPRTDTDLLIDSRVRDRAQAVLLGLGYDMPHQVSGQFVAHQSLHVKRHDGVSTHMVDLHWKVANPQVFAGLLTFAEANAAAVPIPKLSPVARGLSSVHALLVACVHRVAHHYDDDHLIWLYDIHLIASGLTEPEWKDFAELANSRRVVAVCRQSLARASGRFGTLLPDIVMAGETWQAAVPAGESTAAYLHQTRRPVDNFLADVRALPRWTDRLRLMGEHLFPSPAYMREVYAASSRMPLALLYARRAVLGARKWLHRQ